MSDYEEIDIGDYSFQGGELKRENECLKNDEEQMEALEVLEEVEEEEDECLEFQIGLMIEPETQEISIVTENGNKTLSNAIIAPIQNALKRKLDSEKANSSRSSTSPYISSAKVKSLKKSKEHPTSGTLDTASILSAIDNLRMLMTQIAARTEELYEDFQDIKNKHNTWQESSILDRTNLNIPLETKEELEAFEEKLKTDDIPKKLFKHFLLKVDDRSWDRYISSCLFACFKKKLAVLCSFYGKNNNIEIQNLEITKILKECVCEKFSKVRTTDINQAIMKWFHLATDRYRRIAKEKPN